MDSRTLLAAGTTSLPIPSAGNNAILYMALFISLLNINILLVQVNGKWNIQIIFFNVNFYANFTATSNCHNSGHSARQVTWKSIARISVILLLSIVLMLDSQLYYSSDGFYSKDLLAAKKTPEFEVEVFPHLLLLVDSCRLHLLVECVNIAKRLQLNMVHTSTLTWKVYIPLTN